MPPPHNLLTSSIRGFVCNSCRAKLQVPSRAPRLSRSFTAQSSLLQSGSRKHRQSPQNSQSNQSPTTEEELPVVRWFDETPDGVRTEVKEDPEEAELIEDLQHAVKRLKDDIGEDADDVDGDGTFEMPDLESDFQDPMDRRIERLEEELHTLEKLSVRSVSRSNDTDFNDPEFFYIRPSDYPGGDGLRIIHLNNILEKVKKDMDHKNFKYSEKKMLTLWRHYILARNTILSDPGHVPPAAWGLLWNYTTIPNPLNIDRMAHAVRLGTDMKKSGLDLTGPQLLVYIEALFTEGNPESAIGLWKSSKAAFPEEDSNYNDYLELGARMLAENGNIEDSQKIASVIIQRSGDPEAARILIPVIQNCLAATTADASRAWTSYLQFRQVMGSHMQMSDYDTVASLFLKSRNHRQALAVFTDMMLTNDISAPKYDSLMSRDVGRLPAKFNNKFFFGKWMKKLIGEGELEDAHRVLEVMRLKQIRPDAKHVNGLIGAWLRTNKPSYRQLAEDMAWSMIAARLEFVKNREAKNALDMKAPLRPVQTPNKLDYKPISFTPPATIETFSVLLEYYVRAQKDAQLLDLYTTLAKAQVLPNTSFMNTLFSVKSVKMEDMQEVRQIYASLVSRGVQPDLETFRILWLRLKQRYSRGLRNPKSYFSSRVLFAEMMKWAPKLVKDLGTHEMPKELYNLVVLCFGLDDDQVGTAVALRAMQRAFGAYPSEDTVHSIVLQLTGVGSATSPRMRRLNMNHTVRERIRNVSKVLELLKKQRIEVLAESGIVYDDLQGQAQMEENLILLSDLLHIVVRKRMEAESGTGLDTIAMSREAANEMGAPQCVPWIVYNTIDGDSVE
ncbi:pentatricopeptide repeat protein [Rutstroemia sp. NJR-2017a BBW]|nr:pentatricopeptide repeat protein [Rutstroemia sp. NJR-2017a BBW]